jgi:hypothetical protein
LARPLCLAKSRRPRRRCSSLLSRVSIIHLIGPPFVTALGDSLSSRAGWRRGRARRRWCCRCRRRFKLRGILPMDAARHVSLPPFDPNRTCAMRIRCSKASHSLARR